MRDGVNLQKAGHPVIVFVNDPFERAARAQAKGLNEPDLKIYSFAQHRIASGSVAGEEAKAVKAVSEIPGILLAAGDKRS